MADAGGPTDAGAPDAGGTDAGTTTWGWGSDFLQEDGTHPTHDGEAKVGSLGLRFFKTSPVTACWFLANGVCP